MRPLATSNDTRGRPATPAAERSPMRAVALPSEHGGWGLTIEPVVLGLLVVPSFAGAAIGVAAFLAFLARTPTKLVLVDRHRGRRLERTRLAARIAGIELAAIAALVALATARSGWAWWWPVVAAAPLVAIELWYDARSRGRRLVPELVGSIGVAASVASIIVAGGESWQLAAGAWLILTSRAAGSIPFVRAQIVHLRRRVRGTRSTVVAQAAAIAIAAVALALDERLLAGLVTACAVSAFQIWQSRTPPKSAKVLGFTQMALGFALVVATAIGVIAT